MARLLLSPLLNGIFGSQGSSYVPGASMVVVTVVVRFGGERGEREEVGFSLVNMPPTPWEYRFPVFCTGL
jgi:hypothetical protein